MSEVKRYRNTVRHFTDDFGDFIEVCKPGESGDYVAASDYDALAAQNAEHEKHFREISEIVQFVGCEGSDDCICVEGERVREDWCPMCRIGDVVRIALSRTQEQL